MRVFCCVNVTQEGIAHHLLWASKPLTSQEIEEEIKAAFPDLPTLYFVNPVELQSVLHIWHAHVLVRES